MKTQLHTKNRTPVILLAGFRLGVYSGIAPIERAGHFRKMVVESQALLWLCTLAAGKLHQALVLRGDLISATDSWNSTGASATALLHIKSLTWSNETICVESRSCAQLHLLPGGQDTPATIHQGLHQDHWHTGSYLHPSCKDAHQIKLASEP